MRRPALLLLALALAAPVAADTVRLRNGRAYEGVIAERAPEGVRIRLAFGVIVIPHDQVAAVEESPSALAEYLRRREALAARAGATAADWLALARWARANDLPQAVRDTALQAAELDPRLPGLDPLLRPFGLVLDEGLERWIPLEESMARRGFVRHDGEWITKAEHRELLADRERERVAAAQEAAARRVEAAAAAVQRREELAPPTVVVVDDRWRADAAYVVVPWFVPGFPLPVHPHRPPGHGHGHRHDGHATPGYSHWLSRQPGSLLPPLPPPATESAGPVARRSSGAGTD